MKKIKIGLILFALFSIFNACTESFIDLGDVDNTQQPDEIVIPEVLAPEVSVDDPQLTGIQGGCGIGGYSIIEPFEIPELPPSVDLSMFMPPVRSQGYQGSCVAWATAYYLKSYQEKKQFGYDYEDFNQIMSPAYIYNQIKEGDDCLEGSCIENALDLLKEEGCDTWQEFPYAAQTCSALPNANQIESAAVNKIQDWDVILLPETGDLPENYTLLNITKTLLTQENPIVMSLAINYLDFQVVDGIYIANNTGGEVGNGHAIVIVGYDDAKNAFKVVNSWGTGWGDEGYAWINYNFFTVEDDPNHQSGVGRLYVAYDVIE